LVTYRFRVLSTALVLAITGTQVGAAEVAFNSFNVAAASDSAVTDGANESSTRASAVTNNVDNSGPHDSAVPNNTSNSGKQDSAVIRGDASRELKVRISKTQVTPDLLIDQLVNAAFDRDERSEEIKNKAQKYSGPVRRSIAKVSDMAQFMSSYKGFQASSEAADVILEEKQKLKSRASVDWITQKHHDELHPKVVSSLMQIASGLGMPDAFRRSRNVDEGYKQLASLVGDDDAMRALAAMKVWAASVKDSVPPSEPEEPLSVLKMDSVAKKLMESSLKRDPVVLEAKAKLHKYNHRNKLLYATAKVVNTTLSVAMFSPTIISPVAQIALLTFLTATGGPEEAKLLKELYLDRRIECRYKMLNQETTQAINNYNVGAITGNTVLIEFCNLTANKMAGDDALVEALLNEPADAATAAAKTSTQTAQSNLESDKNSDGADVSAPGKSL
jgi:hypothetical protein